MSRLVPAHHTWLLAAAMLVFSASTTWAQFAALAARIPRDANSIVVLNVEQIKDSPLAKAEGWRDKLEKASESGLTILPAASRHFMLAAKMDFEFMHPIWEVALSDLSYQPSIPKIAAKWGGTVENISGRSAALLPDDSYVVQLGPRIAAAMRPASRQSVSRWLSETSTSAGDNLSPYLAEARDFVSKSGTPIILAMDLTDVVSEKMVRSKADQLKMLAPNLDVDQLTKAMIGLRGVTLGISIRDHVSGAILVDFSENVEFMREIAKPLLLHVLENHSAMIEEFKDWEVTVSGNRIRLGGRLQRSGMQRIMSVLDVPGALHDAMPSPSEALDESTQARLASQEYFKSIKNLLDDLQRRPSSSGAQSMGQVGMWFNRYAKRIDGLPMLNVDSALLDYGNYVSQQLRAAETALRNVGGRKRVRQANAPAQYTAYGRWSSIGFYNSSRFSIQESPTLEGANQARISTEERAAGSLSAREIMQDINQATVEIRRTMTEKFKAEF